MELTNAQLRAAIPGASPVNIAKYLGPINATLAEFDISTPQRAAYFLSQIGHETIDLSATIENLNYSVENILKTFGRHRISEADARRVGRIDGKQRCNSEELANLIYGGPWGVKNLGNTEPGDGWKFRGRGAIQTTGRHNMTQTGKGLKLDLINKPELLSEPLHWARSAGWFWKDRGLNKYADAGDLTTLRRIANGGSLGLEDCAVRLKRAQAALGIDAAGKPLKK